MRTLPARRFGWARPGMRNMAASRKKLYLLTSSAGGPNQIGDAPIDVPPRAMAFVVYPDTGAVVCQ